MCRHTNRRGASQLNRALSTFKALARRDELAGLYNRRHLLNVIEEAKTKAVGHGGKPFCLCLIDLDHFKCPYDTFGHEARDVLLKRFAQALQTEVRKTDCIGRYDGEEFMLLLPDMDISDAHSLVERIRNNIGRLVFSNMPEDWQLTASFGLAQYHSPENIEQTIARADSAMYSAKRNGRNQVAFFTKSMENDAMLRSKRISDLSRAVPESQLELYYQPVVELSTGRIMKAEALVRWNHPVDGLVGPADFIAIAEETGMIHDIGDWVFQEVIVQGARLTKLLEAPFQISINMSPLQLLNDNNGIDWASHLQALQVPPHSIVVEITEGVLLSITEAVSRKLKRMRQAGLDFSIDDFGTGYSSMSYLKKLDIDYLKIDRSFVSDMLHDTTTATIAETVILMAHKLGLKVVAEGVETAEQRRWLAEHNCDYGQGYFFSKPIPVADFECLLLKNAPQTYEDPSGDSNTCLPHDNPRTSNWEQPK